MVTYKVAEELKVWPDSMCAVSCREEQEISTWLSCILKFILILQNCFVITYGWYVHHSIDHCHISPLPMMVIILPFPCSSITLHVLLQNISTGPFITV